MTAKVIILGCQGQLAQALLETGQDQGLTMTCLGRPDFDLTEPEHARQHLESVYSPGDMIINTAAYTAVDRAEDDIDMARLINATAPWVLAQWAHSANARFIHISTDYVFGSKPGGPWSEDANPCPVNAYGQTKLEGEQAVTRACPDAAIVRTAGIFSHTGNNFLKTIVRMSAKSGPLRIVDDQLTGPTPADQLARVLLRLAQSDATGIFHASGASASWADFADAILEDLSRRDIVVPGLTRIGTEDFPTPARRPTNSVLSSQNLETAIGPCPIDWNAGIQSYLDRLIDPR